jgi:hypothetical protein
MNSVRKASSLTRAVDSYSANEEIFCSGTLTFITIIMNTKFTMPSHLESIQSRSQPTSFKSILAYRPIYSSLSWVFSSLEFSRIFGDKKQESGEAIHALRRLSAWNNPIVPYLCVTTVRFSMLGSPSPFPWNCLDKKSGYYYSRMETRSWISTIIYSVDPMKLC